MPRAIKHRIGRVIHRDSAPLATSLRHASDKSVIKGFALIRESHVSPAGIGGSRGTRGVSDSARKREMEKIKEKGTEKNR